MSTEKISAKPKSYFWCANFIYIFLFGKNPKFSAYNIPKYPRPFFPFILNQNNN